MTSLFGQQSLVALIRGIRANKKDEGRYISQCIQEIKEELKQDNIAKKAVAIQKLTYLQMLGYDMSWAAFNVVEVMSSTKFTHKRIGYLAAAQSFTDTTDVAMLATNLIRKDFTGANQYDAGIAIDCLANICNPDLARDLAADLVSLLNSSRPYVRKKAVLVLYKIFLKFPEALRPAFPRLREKLEDPDPAVVSCAVNVICELARKNPQNYLGLAPIFFKLLTSSTNNWMLIKIIKLFGALAPLHKGLAKKLADPLTQILNTTAAKSLLYECIQTCTIGLPTNLAVLKLCLAKLRDFVEDPDQNLKYLGLLAMNSIMKVQPKLVAEYRDLVIRCLDDEDVTIRVRALDLLGGMVSKKNLADIITKLLHHLDRAEGAYRDELVEKIVTLCSQQSYHYITDFEWYISILIELTRVQGTKHGKLIASQLMDVIIRVNVIRAYGISKMLPLLKDVRLLTENPESGGICEVLYAAAWLAGEFADYVEDYADVVDSLTQSGVAGLPSHIQSVYVQSLFKLFAHVAKGAGTDKEIEESQLTSILDILQSRITPFTQSVNLEVQERACFLKQVSELYSELQKTGTDVAGELSSLFEEPLNPVAKGAQKKVPVPPELDLDTPIYETPDIVEEPEPIEEPLPDEPYQEDTPAHIASHGGKPHKSARINSPYMLSEKVEDIPIKNFSPQEELPPVAPAPLHVRKPKPSVKYVVNTEEEMPEDARDSGDEANRPYDPLNQDVLRPLEAHEVLPQLTHRLATNKKPKKERSKKEKKSKKSSESKESRHEEQPTDGRKHRHKKDKHKSSKIKESSTLVDFDTGAEEPATPTSPTTNPSEYADIPETPEVTVAGDEDVVLDEEPAAEEPKRDKKKHKKHKSHSSSSKSKDKPSSKHEGSSSHKESSSRRDKESSSKKDKKHKSSSSKSKERSSSKSSSSGLKM